MTSMKVLQSVAHDVAHHARSGLSWLHPHVGQACRSAGLLEVEVQLTGAEMYPAILPPMEPLRLALIGLRDRLWKIVTAHKLEQSSVKGVSLLFCFSELRSDDYLCEVTGVVTGSNGRTYEARVRW
jgi:hypothetical protein